MADRSLKMRIQHQCKFMKTSIKSPFHATALIIALTFVGLAGPVTGQTFTTLHTFNPVTTSPYTNGDGYGPSELLLSGDTLYGTAWVGGTSGGGTVFKVNRDGGGFTTLFNFDAADPVANPGPLVLSGTTLYGVRNTGGSSGWGFVFAVGTNGVDFTTLYNFSAPDTSFFPPINSDGARPTALVLSGSTLYGTTYYGGNSGAGTVFSLNTDGTGFSTLYNFSASSPDPSMVDDNQTNSDGLGPSGLMVSGDTLYGTASVGGKYASGTVFALNTDGTGFRTLHNFTFWNPFTYVNNEGAFPQARLVLSGSTLYGTASGGGHSGSGTVFAVSTNGTSFRVLHDFTASTRSTNTFGVTVFTNRDGFGPQGPLMLSGNTLYGTTTQGGQSGVGTLFAINTDGTMFDTLHSFSEGPGSIYGNYTNSDGAFPNTGLVLSGNTLYGASETGGKSGGGTIFSISLPSPPPQLTIRPDGYGGFFINAQGSPNFSCQLQRAPALTGPWATSASQTADTNGLIQFHDLFPPPARAFYRTVQQ